MPTKRNVAFLLGAGLFTATALLPAVAQTGTQNGTSTPAQDPAAITAPQGGSYATGQPLEQQSKEGFWGHVNPFARKKWVKRQVDPIRDRANELDQLQSKNASDIRDVDSRATQGIAKANAAASAADAHAADAAGRADRAKSMAVMADGKTTSLNGTISNLDQYQQVSALSVPFVAGHTALTTKAKGNLDTMASSLGAEKGYIIEVQGYSRAGVANSQAMADSVVRYLVTEHQVPIYRIYRTGLGKQKAQASTDKPLINGVRVTVLHNSLATMDAGTPAGSAAATPPSLE